MENMVSTRCYNCGSILEENQAFCSECGTKIINDNVISGIDNYNATLVNKNKKGKIIKTIILIFLVLVIIGISIGGYLLYKEEQKRQTLSYAQNILEYAENMKKTASTIDHIAAMYSIAYEADWRYRNTLITYAESLSSADINSVNNEREEYAIKYNTFKDFNIKNSHVEKLKYSLDKVYSSYEGCFNYVINKEGYTGSSSVYLTGFNTLNRDFINNISELEKNAKEVISECET